MTTHTERTDALRDLGLNDLEAEVYLHLLPSSAKTAYSIAKSIGKPSANVYTAIESLFRKGAILVEEGKNRLCSAVPVESFLTLLERDMVRKAERAREQLKQVETIKENEGVFRLQSASLVFEKCISMLEGAEEVVVLDAFPAVVDKLKDAIESTIQRGIRVYLQLYAPCEIEGAEISFLHGAEDSMNYWKADQLNVVVDSRENLLALLDKEHQVVHEAFWSRNIYLSCVLHAGLLHEMTIHKLLANRSYPDQQAKILEHPHFFRNESAPGLGELKATYLREKNDEE